MAHDALIEASLEFILPVFVFPGGKEGAAAHGSEHVALVDLAHLFGGNVVGIEPFGRAFDRKFRDVIVFAAFQAVEFVEHVHEFGERGRNVDAFLVLDALVTLAQNLHDDHGVLFEILVVFIQMQKERDERRLPVGRHQRIDLILNGLYAAFQFVLHAVFHEFSDRRIG